ncbi:MAG: prepilin-type N-terminal cleavage/methylation domain-containing protein [Flavobacteriaceae bacterium]|jgi:prepilin-type N-terminal cleavage/methylation domain-containing protein
MYFYKKSIKTGFTLLEIIAGIAILGIIAAVGIGSLSDFRKEQNFTGTIQETLALISNTKEDTLGSRGDTNYGVHFEESKIVVFEGSSYSSSDPDNRETLLENDITISDISLTNNATEIVFERLTGDVDEVGTITISDISGNAVTITIERTGIVNI